MHIFYNINLILNLLKENLENIQTIESPVTFSSSPQANMSNYKTSAKPSPYLILHAHGGGFIAQSSQSHEIYLKPWCKELKIPIVSIDYALAPEYPYPRASQECFYVYAWCLLNKSVLGWTGERIICVGDSAGGLMVTNIVQQAIVNKIRIPDALVAIYTPFLCTYSISPSRLLAILDPILNLGMLFRCLSAYAGFDFDNKKDELCREFERKIRIKNESKTKVDDKKQKANYDRLEKMHSMLGDAMFLVEHLRENPLLYEPYMSPLFSDDSILAKFPHTCLVVSYMNACLF